MTKGPDVVCKWCDEGVELIGYNHWFWSKKAPNDVKIARCKNPPFDRFWAIYPRRCAKLAACKAFTRALKTTPLETILAGAARYAAEQQERGEPQYTKHPSTWLNGGCWDDDPQHLVGTKQKGPKNGYERRLDAWECAYEALSDDREASPGPIFPARRG